MTPLMDYVWVRCVRLRRLRAVGKWSAGVTVARQTQAGHLSTAGGVMRSLGGGDQLRFLKRQLVLPVSMMSQ